MVICEYAVANDGTTLLKDWYGDVPEFVLLKLNTVTPNGGTTTTVSALTAETYAL